MSTPIVEHIAANIATAIGQVTVANGFNQDLVAIRPKRLDYGQDLTPRDGHVLVMQGAEAKETRPTGGESWAQTFILWALVLDSDQATNSIDTRINQVRADIHKKLMEDPQRGGYALDTELVGSDIISDGRGFSGIALEITVHYRTKDDDPYTQI